MKVFWSWQSDTPGKTGRHFVKVALESAVEELKSGLTLEEPDEREILSDMQVDQDRKGVPGSPDLARTILRKIEGSKVVLADVTPVGFSNAPQGEAPKKLMNPNVAIELGYALKHLGDESLLMVLNEHYGSHGDLPFDLRTKAGPIIYRLAPDADIESIKAASRKLKNDLKEALSLCLNREVESMRQSRPFPEKAAIEGDPARFRDPKDYLGVRWDLGPSQFEDDSSQKVKLAAGPAIFIRVMPTRAQANIWSVPKLADSVQFGYGPPRTFSGREASHRLRADDGLGYYDCRRGEEGKAASVVFLHATGEIWSIDTWSLAGAQKRILIAWEKLFAERLNEYGSFLMKLGITAPLKWVCGLTKVEGFRLQLSNDLDQWEQLECVTPNIVGTGTLDPSKERAETVLQPFFELIFEKCGAHRHQL